MKNWKEAMIIMMIFCAIIFAIMVGGIFGAKLANKINPDLIFSGTTAGSSIFLTGAILGLMGNPAWIPRCRRLAIYIGNFAIGSITIPAFCIANGQPLHWDITIIGGCMGFLVGMYVLGKSKVDNQPDHPSNPNI